MEQTVYVKQRHNDGTATVILQRQSACSGDCHKCAGCGAATEYMVFEANNPIGAGDGDRVVIRSQTAPVMRAAGVFYVVPLVLFFLLYFVGEQALGLGAVFGCLGFALGIALSVIYDRKVAGKEKTVHTIIGYAEQPIVKSGKKGDNRLD